MKAKIVIAVAFLVAIAAMLAVGAPQQSGVSSGSSTSPYAKDAAVVHNTGNENVGGQKTFTSEIFGTSADFSGNVQVGGQLILTGPWSATGPCPGMTITPALNTSQLAFDASGGCKLVVSENDGSVVEVAKVNSNVATASALSAASTLPTNTLAATPSPLDSSTKVGTTNYTDLAVGVEKTRALAAEALLAPLTPTGLSVPWQWPAKCSAGTGSFLTTANKAFIWEINLTYPLSTSKIEYDVITPDNNSGAGHNYDLALYLGVPSATNNRVVHIGSSSSLGQPGTTFAPSSGWRNLAWFEGATTLQPGRYYMMLTSDCVAGTSSCAQLAIDSSGSTLYYNNAASVTTGGVSPATFTSAADAPSALPGVAICVWIE